MQMVKIRLRKPARVLPFLISDLLVQRDEPCVVRSDRGLEFGTCVVPPEPCPPGLEQRVKMSVVRKLNYHDESTLRQLVIEEGKAKDVCFHKIIDRNLPMRLVDVEYSMDKRKVVFYFTAEDRVDFRELVRDLAHDLKTRIELRHIQVRDAAKMVGGLGTCGRELCCTTWLQDFMPISMKMAKRQNLSLNPTKISGQCGRLMCCISYENDMYVTEKKHKSVEVQAPPAPAEVRPVQEQGLTAQDLFRLKVEGDAAAARARARQGDAPVERNHPAPQEEALGEPEQDDREDLAEDEGLNGSQGSADASGRQAPASGEAPRRSRRRRRGRRRPGGGDARPDKPAAT